MGGSGDEATRPVPAGAAAAGSTLSPSLDPARWALATFAALFVMNLLAFTDRWVLAAVLGQVQAELKFDDEQAGMLVFWFLVGSMAVSPIVGYVGDRVRRPWLLALGVSTWSLATIGGGLAATYGQLRIARAALGVGEATYAVIAPAMLADLFGRGVRSRVMAWYALAMPLGGAIGLALGGYLGVAFGWRVAFFVVAAPGLLAAVAALALSDPTRGESEGVAADRLREHQRIGPSREDYIDLMVNSSYTYSVLGMAFYTFALGGLAYWLPKFLTVNKGIAQERATVVLGLVTFAAATTGMGVGGWLADRLMKSHPRALFLLPGLGLLASIPFVLLAIHGRGEALVFGGIFAAEALMFLNTGPCNAVIANVVMPNMRGVAFAVALFAVHLLGDLWSPTLMGWVADTFGRRDAMATPFGQTLAMLGAIPTQRPNAPPENLTAGLLVVIPALVLSGTVLLAGARHLPREMALMLAKLKASPRPTPSAVTRPAR